MKKFLPSLAVLLSVTVSATALSTAGSANQEIDKDDTSQVSPARRIKRDKKTKLEAATLRSHRGPAETGIRSIDGTGNNVLNPDFGAAGTHLVRLSANDYGDGISSLSGANRPSARAITNIVSAQTGSIPNRSRLTDFLWQWGQFLDHDIDLTDGINPPEPANIAVPAGDVFFDPTNTGTAIIPMNRSIYDLATGTDANNPRQQENEITAWIDASNVYGSDALRASTLRANDGTGRLATSANNLLPFNTTGLANAGGPGANLFLAGDVRANEQIGLTSMHTLFMREHNRLADEINAAEPGLTGDEVYERARSTVGALIQIITYQEYLPSLLGRRAIRKYRGYYPNINPGIANEFSAAAYRFGHSNLNEQLLRVDADGNEIAGGHLELREAFFRPDILSSGGEIDPILRGLASQRAQNVDVFVIDAVRNFLFGAPGAGGFDLASLNIQRGRDHGIPSYNATRVALGLRPARSFRDITRNRTMRNKLREAYGTVDNIDLWVGGLAEDHFRGGEVGELFNKIIADQFIALRDGDRFFHRRVFTGREGRRLRRTKLSDIIKRNTDVGRELQKNVFKMKKRKGKFGK